MVGPGLNLVKLWKITWWRSRWVCVPSLFYALEFYPTAFPQAETFSGEQERTAWSGSAY